MSSITSVGSLLALISMLFLQGRIRKSWVLAGSGLVMLVCILLKGAGPQLCAPSGRLLRVRHRIGIQ